MKQRHENRTLLEQLIQTGAHSGTMLCSGMRCEAWHISIGEYEIDGRKTLITDIYICIGENGMIIVPRTQVKTMLVCL